MIRQLTSASPPVTSWRRQFTRTATLVTLAAGVGLVTAACATTPPAPAAPLPTVIVNTPPTGDGGLAVLLTVAGGVALLCAVAAAVLVCLWLSGRRQLTVEHQKRDTVERKLIALTGHIPDEWDETTREDRQYARIFVENRRLAATPLTARPHREPTL